MAHTTAAAHEAFGSTKTEPAPCLWDNIKTLDQSYTAETMTASSAKKKGKKNRIHLLLETKLQLASIRRLNWGNNMFIYFSYQMFKWLFELMRADTGILLLKLIVFCAFCDFNIITILIFMTHILNIFYIILNKYWNIQTLQISLVTASVSRYKGTLNCKVTVIPLLLAVTRNVTDYFF